MLHLLQNGQVPEGKKVPFSSVLASQGTLKLLMNSLSACLVALGYGVSHFQFALYSTGDFASIALHF